MDPTGLDDCRKRKKKNFKERKNSPHFIQQGEELLFILKRLLRLVSSMVMEEMWTIDQKRLQLRGERAHNLLKDFYNKMHVTQIKGL